MLKINCKSFLLALIFVFIGRHFSFAQVSKVTVSGHVQEEESHEPLPFLNVILKTADDQSFVEGVITDENGRFVFDKVAPAKYILTIESVGLKPYEDQLFVGAQSDFIDLGHIRLEEDQVGLDEVLITAKQDEVGRKMDRKSFAISGNVGHTGGSVLQIMSNLPGVSVQNETVKLRGSDKVIILIDGKQSAITGFDGQDGLDNIPSSNIDRIEVINNPSAKQDASGSAGIINIIMKKEKRTGLNGKAGMSVGLGSLWQRKGNYPGVRSQHKLTPKLNPSIALNYKKEKYNLFVQVDDFFTKILSNNDFTTRIYDNGEEVKQQMMRNKRTNYLNTKAGIDWYINENNDLTFAASFTKKTKVNKGDQAFYNTDLTTQNRMWSMYEDDNKTLGAATLSYEHRFKQPGHKIEASADYSFTRRDKDYDFVNTLPHFKGTDAFDLVSDEHVFNFDIDYTKPLKYGKLETGTKFRYRYIPSTMDFIPGENSVLDINSGGWADYKEIIPALYANYSFETDKWEAELGARMEYMKVNYDVNPEHNTYESDKYDYVEPFFNMRLGYKINDHHRLSVFYNRRVDRPTEKDLRIFPKYDDAEILGIGNPSLKPQFTNAFELGYKTDWNGGYLYAAGYHRIVSKTLTRISTTLPNDDLIYNISQNAGKSNYTGLELIFSQDVADWYDFNLNANVYYHEINAFTVENLYPVPQTYSGKRKTNTSGDR